MKNSIVLSDIRVTYNPTTNTLVALNAGDTRSKKATSIAIAEEAALLAASMTHLPIIQIIHNQNCFVFRIITNAS